MVAKRMNLPWFKKAALKIYMHAPRKVQIGLAKFGIKKTVQKKMIGMKKSLKAVV